MLDYNTNTKLDTPEELDPQDTLSLDKITNNDEDSSFTQSKSDSTSISITVEEDVRILHDPNESTDNSLSEQESTLEEVSPSPMVSTSSYVLTPEDQSNLEEAEYISIAYPIMSIALDNLNKSHNTNYSLEKNNGF